MVVSVAYKPAVAFTLYLTQSIALAVLFRIVMPLLQTLFTA